MPLIDLSRAIKRGNKGRLQEIVKIIIVNEGLVNSNQVNFCIRSSDDKRAELDISILPSWKNYCLVIKINKGGSYQELLEYRPR